MKSAIIFICLSTVVMSGIASAQTTQRIHPREFKFCPNHVGGDRDFDGNGPIVKASARLLITKDGNRLMLVSTLEAKETQNDFSLATGKWRTRLYSAPRGFKITGIRGKRVSAVTYTDNNHWREFFEPDGFVDWIKINGDTRGNDIGNCTSDDTYMHLRLNPIVVKIARK